MISETLVNDLLSALQQQDEDAIATQARFILSLPDFEWSQLPLEQIMGALSAGLAEEECTKLLIKVLSQPDYHGICDSHGHLIMQGLQSQNLALVCLSMRIVEANLPSCPLIEAYLLLLNHENLAIVEECSKTVKQHQLEKHLIHMPIEPLRKASALLNGHLREGWELGVRLYRESKNSELDQAALIAMFEEATESLADVQMSYEAGIFHEIVNWTDQVWSYFARIGLLGSAAEIMKEIGLFPRLCEACSAAAYIAKGAWAYADNTLLECLVEDCFSHNNVDLGLGAAKGLSLAAEMGILPPNPNRIVALAMMESRSSEGIRKQLAFELLSNMLRHSSLVDNSVIHFLLDRQSDDSLMAAHWRSEDHAGTLEDQVMQQIRHYLRVGVVSKEASRVMIAQ